MTTQYTLTVKNQSLNPNYLMVFQNDPTSFDPNALSIAWFSKYSNPSSTTKFTWGIDWGFSWSDTGTLSPGVQFDASETAVMSDGNKITLDYNGAYRFINQTNGQDASRLYLVEDGNIPTSSSASIGVTMSGKTVYATQAKPNMNLTFSPHVAYYLAYGNYEEGEVIDVSSVNTPLQLLYPTGVNALSVTLNADNSWSKSVSLSEANSSRLQLARAA